MVTLKKLIFAPFSLGTFLILIYQLNLLFKNYDFIFSLSFDTLIEIITIASLILLTSLLFVLFISLSGNWKIILPIGGIAALSPLVLISQPLNIVLLVAVSVSLLITYLSLEGKLKSYLTFEPNSLLGPSTRHLAGLLVLAISLTFFLSINKTIQQNGFQIPDSIIDTALKFTGQPQSENNSQEQTTQPQLTQEQTDLLKRNPDLLKQYGLGSQPTPDLIKQTVKDQLNNIIKPYSGIIPAVLAVLLFLTLQSLTSLLGLLIYPLLWIIFYILEKSGFIKFEIEQRPVKKMVV